MFRLLPTTVRTMNQCRTGQTRFYPTRFFGSTLTLRSIISSRLSPSSSSTQCYQCHHHLMKPKSYSFRYYNQKQQQKGHQFGGNTSQSYTFDPTLVFLFGVAGIYFGLKAFFVEVYVNRFHNFKDSNGNQIAMKKKLQEQLYTFLDEAHINGSFRSMELAQFVFSTNLEPFVHSCFESRFGVFFGLPIYLNYFPEDESYQADLDLFIDHFGLDKNRLESSFDSESGQSMMDHLKQSLNLSNAGRKFLLLWLLQSATVPTDPFFNSVALVGFPALTYKLGQLLRVSSVPTLVLSVIGGYVLSAASILYMQYIRQRFGYWAVFNYETVEGEGKTEEQTEGETATAKKEELHSAAREYLEKLDQLRKIVKDYSIANTQTKSFGPKQRALTDCEYDKMYPIEKRLKDVDRFASETVSTFSFLI